MIGACLLFAVLLGQVPTTDPMGLVMQLGSARYAQREAAASALEQLGRLALPALRSVKDVKDPEVRTRAASLITKIEESLLTKPTMVALNFHDQPLDEVVQAISSRSGIKMTMAPDQIPGAQSRRITLEDSAPLPYWKAIDRLCEVGQLQYTFGIHSTPNVREPVITLSNELMQPAPLSDSGPFRVNLAGINYQRHVLFSASRRPTMVNRLRLRPVPQTNPSESRRSGFNVNEEFFAEIQIMAEPRLSVTQNGPMKLVEAEDDRGQSLMIEDDDKQPIQRHSAYFGYSAGPTLQLQIPLKRPEHPGQEIKKLRGIVPVVVATRKGDPLVVPLSGSNGKSFHNDEITLEVLELRQNPNTRQTSIQLNVRSNREVGGDAELLAAMPTYMMRQIEGQQQQFEILDEQGRPLPWYPSNVGGGSQMTLTLTSHDQGTPTELRYYSMVRAAAEVPFEFSGVPLPFPPP